MFLNDRSGTFKIEKFKDEYFEVARTRKCAECGSDQEMRGLALHPSLACPSRALPLTKGSKMHHSLHIVNLS